MPLVQDNEADVIQHGRVGSKSEIQLLRRRHDDFAGAQRVLVDVADPHAAVEGRDADPKWRERPCQDLLRLGGQGSQRGDVDRAPAFARGTPRSTTRRCESSRSWSAVRQRDPARPGKSGRRHGAGTATGRFRNGSAPRAIRQRCGGGSATAQRGRPAPGGGSFGMLVSRLVSNRSPNRRRVSR